MASDQRSKWTLETVHNVIGSWSPVYGGDENLIAEDRDDFSKRNVLEEFLKLYAAFLMDDSMSFQEKARRYLDEDWPSGKAFDFFKRCWEIVSSGAPWPLEGRPRPEDESPPKTYQFKPQ